MSFLNSVISSIAGDGKAQSSPATQASKASSNGLNRAGTTSVAKSQTATAGVGLKRKAEDSGSSIPPKTARTVASSSLAPPPSRSASTSPAPKTGILPAKQSAYQGTMKPKTASPAPVTASKPASKPVSMSTNTTTTITKQPVASGSVPPPKPAAKGGYLAMLERAKAAQEAAKPLGQIKHQKIEKLSRRERERLLAEAAANAKKSKAGPVKAGKIGGPRSRDATPLEGKSIGMVKDKKPVEVGYKGTMRPVPQPSYRGTMQSGKPAVSGGRQKSRASSRENEYARWSDEDEQDVEEEDDYDSGSSDMEARIDEIDEEELTSARVARREDEEALREENEQKRLKMERKKKLDQLQAAAAKRKKMY